MPARSGVAFTRGDGRFFEAANIQIKQNAALCCRIVTGLKSYALNESVYYETGWETLAARRKQKKLCLMYKIQTGNAPEYLSELLPSSV